MQRIVLPGCRKAFPGCTKSSRRRLWTTPVDCKTRPNRDNFLSNYRSGPPLLLAPTSICSRPTALTTRRHLTTQIRPHTETFSDLVKFYNKTNSLDYNFASWLAGLVDASGHFAYKGKGDNLKLTITASTADLESLQLIKRTVRGGVIKEKAGGHSQQFSLANRDQLKNLEACLSGHLRHSCRLQEYHRSATELEIPLVEPFPISPTSPWFAGFFSIDGAIDFAPNPKFRKTIDEEYPELFIKVNDKNWIDLVQWKENFGGEIRFDTASNGKYFWIVWQPQDIKNFIDKINKSYPSAQIKRFAFIDELYRLRESKTYRKDSSDYSLWEAFKRKWKDM